MPNGYRHVLKSPLSSQTESALMAAARSPLPVLGQGHTSRELIRLESANELFFAVVGHAGSGTSVIAQALKDRLEEEEIDVVLLKARDVIEAWAAERGHPIPASQANGKRLIKDVETLQDYGDQMRAEKRADGRSDHGAVARALISRIREVRAQKLGVSADLKTAIVPDGTKRAYILDALRHPSEVELLRGVYGDAFVLIGVVCEEGRRIERLTEKYSGCGKADAREFMRRDADAKEPYGQHVADAFHISDFFIDNTVDRMLGRVANREWVVSDSLSRLIKIVTQSELKPPTVAETAMCHAYDAQLQSACLSRQVGAALIDSLGNVVATGTNEVPKAGGGVYGETLEGETIEDDTSDGRCAFRREDGDLFCRNTRTQNEIIDELLSRVPELDRLDAERKARLKAELRATRIGSLLEFSRAVHAEMDALLSAARKGAQLMGTRLFVTTFPCHYCARHIIAAGVDEVQYIEPYPKSLALNLHRDAIDVEQTNWQPPSACKGGKVLFRHFSGIAPRMYRRAFRKDRDLKDKQTGVMKIGEPEWASPWQISRRSYPEMEVELLNGGAANG